jgi:glycosyltransferase involved in cell wall biosynthesis
MLFGLERSLLRHASRTVVVTDSFRRRVVDKGVAADQIHVIPNGVDLERYRSLGTAVLPGALTPPPGSFLVGYLGNFGAGQELRTVLDAAALWQREAPEVHVLLVGDGKEKRRVIEHASALGLWNVTIHPPIEKDLTPAFYNVCDVCLVPLAPIPIFQETVPSKLFEVMACERPLVASVAGEAARVVADSGGGMVTAPGDARALADAVLRLRAASCADRERMGARGRAYARAHYSRKALAGRYLAMLEALVKGEATTFRQESTIQFAEAAVR